MITYEWVRGDLQAVFIDGKRVGKIVRSFDGMFYYLPKGATKGGDKYKTIEEVKKSLEEEDDS